MSCSKEAIKEIHKIVEKLQKCDTERSIKADEAFDKIVEKYIRENKLIVTGQRAIEAMLPNDIPPDPTKNNFEIISDRPHQHRNQLADLIGAAGFEDIQRTQYGTDPIIAVKHRTLVKFRYAKKPLFDSIDTREINGIKYESEIMMKIKAYSNFTDPVNSISDWKQWFLINKSLNKKFDLETGTKLCFIQKEFSNKNDTYQKIKKAIDTKFLQGNKNIIIVGLKAYQLYINESKIGGNIYKPDDIRYYEVLSMNMKEDIETIKKVSGGNLTIRKSGSTLDYHSPKISIYYDNQKLIDLYDAKHECIPFTAVGTPVYTLGSFHLVLKYLYIGLWVAKKQINNKLLEQKNWCLINNLIKARDYYLMTHNQLGLETSPFKIFHTLCVGTREDIKLINMVGRWEYLAKKFKNNSSK
jgi:hypothetical protein